MTDPDAIEREKATLTALARTMREIETKLAEPSTE